MKNATPLKLVCIGASCRAIVEKVAPSGNPAGTIDLFGDRDTFRFASTVLTVESLVEVATALRGICRQRREVPLGVLLAGGMENHVKVVAELESDRGLQLLGCCAESIRRARDPFHVTDILRKNHLPFLRSQREPPDKGTESAWVGKRICSGGGIGVSHPARVGTSGDGRPDYYQEFRHGEVIGASYIGIRPDECNLIGCCRQFFSGSIASDPFRYEGSLGPVMLRGTTEQTLKTIGRVLSAELHLRGWFGIDFVIDQAVPWLLEINPRFTASMELLEGRGIESMLEEHLKAFPDFESFCNVRLPSNRAAASPLAAKRILFNDANIPLVVSESTSDRLFAWNETAGSVRDVPRANVVISPGEPVCTILSRGDLEAAVLNRLNQTFLDVRQVVERDMCEARPIT